MNSEILLLFAILNCSKSHSQSDVDFNRAQRLMLFLFVWLVIATTFVFRHGFWFCFLSRAAARDQFAQDNLKSAT